MPRTKATARKGNNQADREAAKRFVTYLTDTGHRVVRCNSDLYLYIPSQGLYQDCSSDFGTIELRCIASEAGVLADYSSMMRQMNKMLKMFYMLDEVEDTRDDDFLVTAAATRPGKQLFKNGIWDARAKTILPFSPDCVFFEAVDCDIDASWLCSDAVLTDNAQNAMTLIESIIGPGAAAQYFISGSARTLACEKADKRRLFLMIGDTDSGKGVLNELFNAAFRHQSGNTDASFLTRGFCRGTGLRDKEFLVPLKHKTFVFTQGITSDTDLKGDLIKSIIRGDKQTVRETRGKMQCFSLNQMFVMCVDKQPIIAPCDNEIADMLAVFLMPYRYVPHSKLESGEAESHWRVADPDIKDTVHTEKFRMGMIELLVKSYVSEEPDRPPSVAADTIHMLGYMQETQSKIRTDLKQVIEYTGKHTDFVTEQELFQIRVLHGDYSAYNKISNGLLAMGRSVFKKTRLLPGNDKPNVVYTGLKMIVPTAKRPRDE